MSFRAFSCVVACAGVCESICVRKFETGEQVHLASTTISSLNSDFILINFSSKAKIKKSGAFAFQSLAHNVNKHSGFDDLSFIDQICRLFFQLCLSLIEEETERRDERRLTIVIVVRRFSEPQGSKKRAILSKNHSKR